MPQTVEKPESARAPLYETVAERVSYLIDQGTFGPGDRIPSVRRLSHDLKVSITTVMEAYRLLEDRGFIEARPQSGYYVRARFPNTPSEPEVSQPPSQPTAVGVGDLILRVLRDARNPNLLPLGAAIPNPDLLPIDRLNRCLMAAARKDGAGATYYDVPPGCEALRVQVARRALAAGCALTPDDIVTTSGAQEAISLCLQAVCRPGDTVALESPIYYGILQVIEALGLHALEIPSHPREGIRLEALRCAIEQNTIRAVLVISNFNNPIGSCIPEEKKRELVELLARHEIPLIEDDIYGDLCFSPQRPPVAKAYDRKGLVMLCASFSKTIAPGYRVGWTAPGRFKAEVERRKFVSNIASATPPQRAIADFLANGGYDHHLRRVRRVYARQTVAMAQAVGRCFPDGTRVTRPTGGFVLWVELPEGTDALALYTSALAAGIGIAPGPIFSAKSRYPNFLRLNAAYWSEKIERAIATLGELAALRDIQRGHGPTG